jgi:hypothetical protein
MAERIRPVVKAATLVGVAGAGAFGGIAVTGGFGERGQAPVADQAPSARNLRTPITNTAEGTPSLVIPTPTVTETAKKPTLKELGGGVSVAGIKSSVEINVVDVAKPEFGFKNTWGHGTEGFLADDGKVLVGPEFPQNIIDGSKGAIDRINPLNQEIFTSGEPEHWPLPEGGFSVVMFGGGTITYGDKVMHFEHEEGRQYMVILRGPNADRLQDSDLNGTFTISDYVAGHAAAQNYDGNPHGGFISQEHFGQMIQNAHNNLRAGGQNCGAEGCSEVITAMLDVNTDAAAVVKHVDVLADGEAAHPVTKVDPVYSNFPTRK